MAAGGAQAQEGGRLAVEPGAHGESRLVYTATYQTCHRVGLQSAALTHAVQPLVRRGRLDFTIGAPDALHLCHILPAPAKVATAVRVRTRFRDVEEPFGLIQATRYDVYVNGARMGHLEVGLVGDHEFVPASAD